MRIKTRPDFAKIASHTNPFINEGFKILVHSVYSGTAKDGKRIEKEYEAEKYAKVFTAPDYRKAVCKLAPPAQRLLLWIIFELDTSKDFIWLNRQRFMEESDVKALNTVRAGVRELVAKQFITPTILQNTYWINPALMFCGSRPNKYPGKVILK